MTRSTEKKCVVLLSLADLSEPNGQGIYARKVLSQIAEGLNDNDVRLKIIAPEPKVRQKIMEEFPKAARWHWLPSKKNRSIYWHVFVQFAIFWNLIRIRPNAVIFSVKPSLVSIEIARWFIRFDKIILVEGLGKSNLRTLGGWGVRILGDLSFKLIFRGAKAVFPAYSSALKWVNDYNLNCHQEIIPCGVDTEIFHPTFNRVEEKNQQLTIGYVGSFRGVHRLDILINLLLHNSNLRLILIGVGEKLNLMKKLVKQFDMESRVEFLGAIEQAEIPRHIQPCSLMWAYTDINHWGVPIKAFEYLACNKFVIASKRAEFEFIDQFNFGITLATDVVEEISDILKPVINMDSRINSLNQDSYDYIRINHNWQNFRKVGRFVEK